jgi:hypothetical protein
MFGKWLTWGDRQRGNRAKRATHNSQVTQARTEIACSTQFFSILQERQTLSSWASPFTIICARVNATRSTVSLSPNMNCDQFPLSHYKRRKRCLAKVNKPGCPSAN